MVEAKKIHEVFGIYDNGYQVVDYLERRIRVEAEKTGIKKIFICYGAAGTCLAKRLSRDLHALDLGHIGWLVDSYKRGKYE